MTPVNTTPTTHQQLRCERGETLFYTLVGIPILLGFCMLSLDLTSWQVARQALQRESERIVLEAAEFLPVTKKVELHVAKRIAELESIFSKKVDYGLKVDASEVSLTLESKEKFFFDLFSKNSHVLATKEISTAKIIPNDYVIIISDASSLRPRVGELWGDQRIWPESSYFKFASAPGNLSFKQKTGPQYWTDWWKEDFNTTSFKRWATQQCFNPHFSALKFASIALVKRILKEKDSRLAVLFTPGDGQFSLVRPFEFIDQKVSHLWSNYFEASSSTSDEACVYYSSMKTTSDSRYAFHSSCENQFKISPFKDGRGHFPSHSLNRLDDCVLSGAASLEEIIYNHSSRDRPHSVDSIVASIKYAAYLLSTGQTEQPRRGNLSPQAKKKIILILDSLINLSSVDLEGIDIDYVFYAHEGLENRDHLIARAESYAHLDSFYLAKTASDLDDLSLLLQRKDKQVAIIN